VIWRYGKQYDSQTDLHLAARGDRTVARRVGRQMAKAGGMGESLLCGAQERALLQAAEELQNSA